MIIVHRFTTCVKRGRMDELLELVKADRERTGGTHRIYRCALGPNDTIAHEIEFENFEAYQKGWDEWSAQPEAAEVMVKWNELTEAGGTNQIWELVE